jgi:hypothetical protein
MSGIDRGRLAEPRFPGPDERETFGPALGARGLSQRRASRLPHPRASREGGRGPTANIRGGHYSPPVRRPTRCSGAVVPSRPVGDRRGVLFHRRQARHFSVRTAVVVDNVFVGSSELRALRQLAQEMWSWDPDIMLNSWASSGELARTRGAGHRSSAAKWLHSCGWTVALL